MKKCADCGRFYKPVEPEDSRCQECIDVENMDDEYYDRIRMGERKRFEDRG